MAGAGVAGGSVWLVCWAPWGRRVGWLGAGAVGPAGGRRDRRRGFLNDVMGRWWLAATPGLLFGAGGTV